MTVVISLCSDTVLQIVCALQLDIVQRQCRNNEVPRKASSSHEQCSGCPMVGE